MKLKRIMSICLITALSFSLMGCNLSLTSTKESKESSASSSETTTKKNEDTSYMDSLEEGEIYVRHKDTNQCEKAYFGNATFDVGSGDGTDLSRVMWFKDDYNQIPTMYSGDSLIMYSSQSFDEKFTFERFYALPYTIGICNMTRSDSNRYRISTNISDRCTYPGGDTDVILNLTNEMVIMDTIGTNEIRASVDNDTNEIKDPFLSEGGTLLSLTKDNTYEVTIYDGTVANKYKFKADVKPMVSKEYITSNNYKFEGNKVITINFPEYLVTGYYLINGKGLIRYIKGNSYDEANASDSFFNTPNASEDPSGQTTIAFAQSTNEGYDEELESEYIEPSVSDEEKHYDSFELSGDGFVTAEIEFFVVGEPAFETYPHVKVSVLSPSGKVLSEAMSNDENKAEVSFTADGSGVYKIVYYNLYNRTTQVGLYTE